MKTVVVCCFTKTTTCLALAIFVTIFFTTKIAINQIITFSSHPIEPRVPIGCTIEATFNISMSRALSVIQISSNLLRFKTFYHIVTFFYGPSILTTIFYCILRVLFHHRHKETSMIHSICSGLSIYKKKVHIIFIHSANCLT